MNTLNSSGFSSDIFYPIGYSENAAAEGYTESEPNLPHGSQSQQFSPAYDSYQLQKGQAMSTESMAEDATPTSLPSSSYTGSDCQLEENNTGRLGLDYSAGSNYTLQHVDYECDMKDNGYPDCNDAAGNASARVLGHLGNILRKKINLELEEFQATIHDVLDGHMGNIQHLFNLSQPNDTEVFYAPQSDKDTAELPDLNHAWKGKSCLSDSDDAEAKESYSKMDVDLQCYKFLTSMFISGATISEAFRTKKKFAI